MRFKLRSKEGLGVVQGGGRKHSEALGLSLTLNFTTYKHRPDGLERLFQVKKKKKIERENNALFFSGPQMPFPPDLSSPGPPGLFQYVLEDSTQGIFKLLPKAPFELCHYSIESCSCLPWLSPLSLFRGVCFVLFCFVCLSPPLISELTGGKLIHTLMPLASVNL